MCRSGETEGVVVRGRNEESKTQERNAEMGEGGVRKLEIAYGKSILPNRQP